MEVTVEYMILIPVLILQIFLFPMFANVVMNHWVDEQKTLGLQQDASYLSSSIEQVYLSLNHTSILSCTITSTLNSNPMINGYYYKANGSLQAVSGSSKILHLTISLIGQDLTASTSVTLGQNVQWAASTFMSNSTSACVTAQKLPNQTIMLSFGT